MQLREYKNIFQNEDSHFFYVGSHQTTLKLLEKYLKSKNNVQILDAGCGTGLLLKKLEKFGKTFGVDISNEAIKFAHKRKLKRIQQSSIMKLPFKKNSFDAVTCIDVIYHQKVHDLKAISEIYSVLKPGGILVIKVPAYEWLRGHHDKVVATKHRYTKKELQKKIKNAGFEIIRNTYANSYLLPLAITKRFIFDKILPGNPKSDVQKIPSLLNTLLILANKVETKILTNFDLPAGLSIYAVCQKPKAHVTK